MMIRALAASLWLACCFAAHAQNSTASAAAQPRLPGSAEAGHFHFDGQSTPSSRFARNLGQSAARVVADKQKMGGKTLVSYEAPTPACQANPSQHGC
jgi:hypothetical protein